MLGTYSKCSAYMQFYKQGREFPVFERGGVKFGVIICADGGYIEPARILALKGARVIFAPHFNYIGIEGLIEPLPARPRDHIARAVENMSTSFAATTSCWARMRRSRSTTAKATATATSSTPTARCSCAAAAIRKTSSSPTSTSAAKIRPGASAARGTAYAS